MTTAYATAVLATSGLVSFWELDETSGTVAADSKGSNPGTYTGGYTLNQAGVSGRAALFNGTTGYVTVPNAAALAITGNISLEAWVKPTGAAVANQYHKVIDKGFTANSPPYDDYCLMANAGPGANLGGSLFGANYYSSTVPAAGLWYHLAMVYNGSNVKIYVNGRLESTGAGSGAVATSGQPLMIAAHNRGGNIGEYFPGTVDAAAVYNTALSAATVANHFSTGWYPAGTGGRTSADGADASFNFGNVTALDGQSSALLCCWVNVAAWTATNQPLFNRDSGGGAGWQFSDNALGDPINFRVFSGGTTYYSVGNVAGQGWVHVAAYVNTSGSVVRTYRNGVLVTNTTGNQLTNPGTNLTVSLQYPAEAVAEPALYRALTSGQADTIVANLAAGAAPMLQTPAPVFYCHFGSGSTETDLAGSATATVPANSLAVAGPVLVASSYTLSGPASGTVNVASTNFTVTPVGGPYTGTVTPHSTGSGTFSPSSLTFSGSSAAQTFTYTPTSTTGSPHTVSTTSSPQLGSDPAGVVYTVNPVLATSYTLSGPASGALNAASTAFTVTPVGGVYTGTVTPHTTGAGTFSPSSLTFSASSSPQTFTYTPTTVVGSPHTVSTTASPALGTDPAGVAYAVTETGTWPVAVWPDAAYPVPVWPEAVWPRSR